MAKSKVPDSESVKEQTDIFKQAEENFRAFSARQAEIAKGLEGLTQQSSTFFQLAAEGAAKAAERMNDLDSSSAGTTQNIGGLTKAIEKQGKAFEKSNKEAGFKKGGDGKNNVFQQLANSSKVAKAGVTLLATAFGTLARAIKGVTSILGGIWDLLSAGIGAIKSIIGGAIDFVSGMFETLVEQSDTVKELALERAQALEKVKETFGNLEKGSGKAMAGFVSKSMALFSPTALRQMFGSYAEASEYALGLVSEGAEVATLLSDQFEKSGIEIVKFSKGLGMVAADMTALMNISYATGKSVVDLQKDIAKLSQGMGQRLNLNVKLLSKNILIAAKDVKHFGTATVKSMAESAAYAAKMGVSLDKIVGVLDKFDTFESAAENVSKLSQAFGVNLDTMKLVEAETPEERMELLKNSFAAAGKSLDSLSRRELSYAASLVGTDEATLKNILSNKGQANSLDAIKDASSAAAKEQRSTASVLEESMKGVAMQLKNIQRQSSGFFDVFLDGIAEGIILSGPMQKVLGNLSKALDTVFLAGKQLGAIIVKTFPGLEKMINALAQFFDPTKIGDMFGGFTKSFEKFFGKLKNGTGDVKELFSDLFDEIKSYFVKQGPAGQEFLSGATEFWNGIKQIIATAILAIGDLFADGLSFIADFLEGKTGSSSSSLAAAAGKGIEKVKKEFSPISGAFEKSLEKMRPAFDRIFNEISERLDKWWENTKKKIYEWWKNFDLWQAINENPTMAAILTLFLAGKVISIASTVSSIASVIGKGLTAGISAATPAANALTGSLSSVGTSFAAIVGPAAAIAAAAAALKLAYDQGKQFYAENSDMISEMLRGGRGTNEQQAAQQENRKGKIEASKNKSLEERLATLREVRRETEATDLSFTGKLKSLAGAVMDNPSTLITGVFGAVKAARISNNELDAQLAKDADARYQLLNEHMKFNPSDAAHVIKTQQDTLNDFLKDVRAADMEVFTAFEEEAQKSATVRDFSINELREGIEIGGKKFTITDPKMIRAFLEKRNLEALKKKGAGGLESAAIQAAARPGAEQLASTQRAQASKEEGEKLMQQAAAEMGLTTVDNLDERMKKISELAKTVSGSKEAFEKDMKTVRETLKSMNFSLFESNTDRDKFAMALGDVSSITAFQTAINKLVVSFQDTGKILANLGSSAEPGTILSNYLISLGKLAVGLRDLYVMFLGGKLLNGAETEGLAEYVTRRSTVPYEKAARGVELHAALIRDFNVSLNKLSIQLNETSVNVQLIAAYMSADNFFSNLQALGILMGGVESEEGLMSISEMFGAPEDLTSTADAIKAWTMQSEAMFDSLGKSLQRMNNSFSVVDELKRKISSVAELRQQLDSTMQSLYAERDIQVQTGVPSPNGAIPAKAVPSKIQAASNVNMTLNFEIKMDATSLEKALIARSDSIVVTALTGLAEGTNKSVFTSPGYGVTVGTVGTVGKK